MCLSPGYTYNRIVVIRWVAEVVFYQRLVVSKLTAPYQGIRYSTCSDIFVFIAIEHIVYPVQIFTIVNIAYLSAVDVKGVYSFTGGDVVPVAHYILFSGAHGKGTTLNKHQSGTGTLFFFTGYLVSAHVFIIVIPTGNVRLFFLVGLTGRNCG